MRKLLTALTACLLALPAAAQVPPIQPPPGMAPSGSNALLPKTIIHQDGGGWNGGAAATGGCTPNKANDIVFANQNDCRIIDNSSLLSNDPSLIVYAGLSGTSTSGQSFGINWTIAGTLYQIRYTSTGAGLVADATGLAAQIAAVADPALAAATYPAASPNASRTQASEANAAVSGVPSAAFDYPWSSGNTIASCPSAVLSASITVTLTDAAGNAVNCNTSPTDNGPVLVLGRSVGATPPTAGRAPQTADQYGQLYFTGPQASGVLGVNLGSVGALAGATPGTYGVLQFQTTQASTLAPRFKIGAGFYAQGFNDPGSGNINVGGASLSTAAVGGALIPSTIGTIHSATNANLFFIANLAGQGATESSIGSVNDANSATQPMGFSASSFKFINGGVQLGAPTGGAQGVGTLNLAAGGVYDNGTAPTGTGAYVHQTSPSLVTPLSTEATSTKTANYTVLNTDSGQHFDNTGAAGEVDFTLPTYVAGLKYCFTVTAAQTLKVIAPAANKIAIGTTNSAAAGNMTATAVYSTACIYATTVSNQWAAKSTTGSWTVN
jgi:hypothetical protein